MWWFNIFSYTHTHKFRHFLFPVFSQNRPNVKRYSLFALFYIICQTATKWGMHITMVIFFLLFFLIYIFSVVIACCCSVTQLCPTLCNPMDCSTPGFPVLHHLPEFTQTQVCWIEMPSNQLSLYCPLLLLPSILGHGLVNLFLYVFVMNHTTIFKVTHLLSV